jgi:hypothetical protein
LAAIKGDVDFDFRDADAPSSTGLPKTSSRGDATIAASIAGEPSDSSTRAPTDGAPDVSLDPPPRAKLATFSHVTTAS